MTKGQILDDRSAEVTTEHHDRVMAEVVVHQCEEISRVSRHIVESAILGAGPGDVTVPEPAQVRHDHLEPCIGQRLDHLPEDAFGLWPAVHTQEWNTSRINPDERLAKASGARVLHGEARRVEIGVKIGVRLVGHRNRVGEHDLRHVPCWFVTPDEFRQNGYALIDWITDYIEGIEQLPVSNPAIKPGDVRSMLPAHPPTLPEPFDAVLKDMDAVIVPGLTHWQHPSFFAYFPGNSSYPAILGELASAGLGVQGMSWVTSPACTEVETLMLDWMQELLGLPEGFRSDSVAGGGVIQGSASEATLAAILAARWRITVGDVNVSADTTRLVAYTTSQAHSSIEKGLRIAGIGTSHMRLVPHDDQFAMRADALQRMITDDRTNGLIPFFVCSSRGTTSSTAFDPTPAIGEICQTEGLWLHVDAAMSGIAALVPELRWVNDGLELADSYCTNPHKWMGVNFDCDLFWTTDRASLLGALSILPEYLRSKALETGAAIDYRDWQIPLGRRFRALKLWFTLRCDGVAPAQAMIREHVRLTQGLADSVAADDRFQIDAPHPLNLLCISLRSGSEATDSLIAAANETGQALFTRTVLNGLVSLRFSIGGRLTSERHVAQGWALLQSLAEQRLAQVDPPA